MSEARPLQLWHPAPRALWILLALHIALALAYSLAIPPFEPADEFGHFRYVRYLIEARRLPVFEASDRSEYHQPPLYYLLAAALSWPFPAADLPDYAGRQNPFRGYYGWEPSVDNRNIFIHGPWDRWPLHGAALSLYAARSISLLAGAVTVLLTYQMARALLEEPIALAAAGMVAFMPMFLAVSGSLENDAGATTLGAAILWLGVHYYQSGFTPRRSMALGIAAGVGGLMKITAALLLAPAALLLVVWGWRRRLSLQRAAGHVALLMAGAALTGGWPYLRNLVIYGDVTALGTHLKAYDRRTAPLTLDLWRDSLVNAWTSFWGRFGYGYVILPAWTYQLLAVISLLALIGLAWRLVRHDQASRVALGFLGAAVLVEFAGLAAYVTLTPLGANARLTFPALPACMTLWALGLLNLVPRNLHRRFGYMLLGGMLALNAFVLAAYILPAYSSPPVLAALPPGATSLNVTLGDVAVLKGYEVSAAEAHPGDRVFVTLYWQPLRRTERPYAVYLHLIPFYDSRKVQIAQRDTYPGLGRNATTAWTPGEIFADRYMVVMPESSTVPTAAYWEAGLWQIDTGDYASVLDAAGQPVAAGVGFGKLALTPRSPLTRLPPAAQPLDATLGDVAVLKGYEVSALEVHPGDLVSLTLYWQPLRRTDLPYSVYLHLMDSDETVVTQRDSYPGLGRYPTTAWVPGQLFADRYLIQIPDTAYAPVGAEWEAGLWQAETGDHAFVTDSSGAPVSAGVTFGKLVLNPRPGSVPNPVDLNFGGVLRLKGYTLPARVLTPGQPFDLTVYWQKALAFSHASFFFVQVAADDGRIWADGRFEATNEAQTLRLTLASTTPPGVYSLLFGVLSDAEAGAKRVRLLTADGQEADDHVRLTGVRVVQP